MELDQAKYIIKKSSNIFSDSYQEVFNTEWYPKKFIKEGYSIFFIKAPDNETNYFNWNTFIQYIRYNINGSKYFFKSYDTTVIREHSKQSDDNINKREPFDIEKRLMIPKTDFFELLNHLPFNNLIGEINIGNVEQGTLLFDDTSKWGYYYGEQLYNGKNFQEFDLFIIRKEDETNFKKALKNMMLLPYNIEEIGLKNIFKEGDFSKNELFEIKI